MKASPIFVVLGVVALLGWCTPDVRDSDGAAAATAGDGADIPGQTQMDMARQQQWYAGNAVLERAPDGHFYADVTIDGTTRNMLVDTGASVIALTGEDARAMGVAWNEADVRPVASEKDATRAPFPMVFTSGSLPTLPIRMALFKLRLTGASSLSGCD